jgi:S-(hydroxymethyl)glutathione dehydrogenase/alcohol dehydrogenase
LALEGALEVALGPGTERRFEPGDRVVGGFIMPCEDCDACSAGRDDLCRKFFEMNRLQGTLYDGTSRLARSDGTPLAMYSMAAMADYCVVPIGALARLPERLPLEASAILGCAAMTAFGAVTRTAGFRQGQTAVVIGTGGIGMSMLQIAAGIGARRLIAVDVVEEKLSLARALGATHTVDASHEDPVIAVRRITDGAGVDFAFEALGRAETVEQAIGMLGDGGRVIAVGLAAGRTCANVEITPLVRRGQGLLGSYGARTRIDLPAVVSLAEEERFDVSVGVTSSYPLEDAAQAFDDLASQRIVGRAVLSMG